MKNSKSYLLIAVAAFALTIGYNVYFKSAPKNNVGPRVRFNQVIGNRVSPQTVPRVKEYVEAVAAAQNEPDVCRESRDKLLTRRIEEIVADVADRRTSFDLSCLPFDEAVTTKDLADAIYKNCRREKLENPSAKQDCWQALTFFKANLVTKAFGARSISEADAETLIYLFMAKISQGEYRTPAELNSLNEVTEHLVQLMPDSPSAHKAATIPRVVADFENMSKGGALNPEVDAYLDSALKINPNDPELQEVSMVRKLYSPGEKISVDKAEALAGEKPDSSMAQYFLAGALENSGHHQEALAAAKRAHDLEPENSRYKETLQKLARGEKKAFMIQLGIGFDNL
jgi:hypothetical protein